MKKTFSLLLAVMLILLSLAACMPSDPVTTPSTQNTTSGPTVGSTSPSNNTDPAGTAQTSTAAVLAKIWNSYGEDERFSVYGGSLEQAVTDGPGDLTLSGAEELSSRYFLTQELVGKLTEAASMVHLMNNNIFTSFALKLTPGASVSDFAQNLRSSIQSNQWICGQPDKLLMAQVEQSTIVIAFGSSDLMDTFKGKLTAAYSGAAVLYDEAIVA